MNKMVLNAENDAQVRHVVGQALQVSAQLQAAEEGLKFHKWHVEKAEQSVDFFRRLRDDLDKQIKALGFHDIGHARTEMAQVKDEQKR